MKKIEQTLTSLEVAEMVGRKHNEVLKDIRRIERQLPEGEMHLGDYFIESVYRDANNQQRPQFLLTKKGCELYSTRMTGKKGTQFAVAYIERFNQMEQQLKQGLVDLSQLSPDLQAFGKIFNSMARMELSQKETIERVDRVEKSQEGIKEVIMISNENWRNSVNKIINTIAKKNGGSYSQARKESYSRLENRGRCILDRRLENKKERMRKEGQTKSNINKVNKLDVIDDDQKLKEIYLAVVKEMAIEYGVEKELA